MAYTGFSKLCQYLWRSSSHELHANVSVWVEELLDSLQSTSRSKILSVTRRSAGLPFYLQVCWWCFYVYIHSIPNTFVQAQAFYKSRQLTKYMYMFVHLFHPHKSLSRVGNTGESYPFGITIAVINVFQWW